MRIVICGASIAGLAAASVLARQDHDVMVVERAEGVRRGGVAIDVRGSALEVVSRLGLSQAIQSAAVMGQDTFAFVDETGAVKAELRVAEDFYDSPDDVEISRDDLCDILGSALPATVSARYGLGVSNVTDLIDHVNVELSDGSRLDADLVVGADGMHSTVRSQVFGAERQYLHHLGLYVGILKECAAARGGIGTRVFNAPGRMVMLRSDGRRSSALLGFRSDWLEYDYRDVESHRQMVADAFADEDSWLVPEALGEVHTSADFYFDSVSQIKMKAWHRGRTVLIGDAGYCASFFSGMGTTLALVGAWELGEALRLETDLEKALERYSTAMKPYVDHAHEVAEEGARLLFPLSAEAIGRRDAEVRALSEV